MARLSVRSTLYSVFVLPTAILFFLPANAADCGYPLFIELQENKNNRTALVDALAPTWVSQVEYRGTFDILQSCTVTLVACVYTALHLNIPPRDKRDWFNLTVSKVKWMLVALFAPEITLTWALEQLLEALTLRNNLNNLIKPGTKENRREETNEKTDLCGPAVNESVAEATPGERIVCNQEVHDSEDAQNPFSLRFAYYVVMGGIQFRVSALRLPDLLHNEPNKFWKGYFEDLGLNTDNYRPGEETIVLTPVGLFELVKAGSWLSSTIPESRIEDKSKSDTLKRILVLVQISWVATVCVTRKILGLPLTLLEIHTTVHVVCAIGMFLLWFKKPLDIHDVDIYKSFPANMEEPLSRMVHATFVAEVGITHSFCFLTNHGRMAASETDRTQVFESFITGRILGAGTGRSMTLSRILMLSFSFANIIYGGIHLTAWNFIFPSLAEQLLWKIACIFIMVATPISFGLFGVAILLSWIADSFPHFKIFAKFFVDLFTLLGLLFLSSVFLLRIFIVVESFISLRYCPIGVYWVPAWLQYFPHV